MSSSPCSVPVWFKSSDLVSLFGNLLCEAAERESETRERILEMLTSVCRYKSFPLSVRDLDDCETELQCDFLLDLFSHLEGYEIKTGLKVLPAFQSLLQSAPSVWTLALPLRNASQLAEVMKLQPEKKPVTVIVWPDEQSEMESFLQCLPYISQLR